MIQAVALDFDGTLVPSHHIKRQAYYDVTADIPGASAVLDEILPTMVGSNRFQVCQTLYASLRRRGAETLPSAERLAQFYGELCEAKILDLLAPAHLAHILHMISEGKRALFVVTATPRMAIQTILEKSGLADRFEGIYGAPASKADNLRKILKRTGLAPSAILVVGDGESDRQAAAEMGTRFVGVTSGEGNFASDPTWTIETIAELPTLLTEPGGVSGPPLAL